MQSKEWRKKQPKITSVWLGFLVKLLPQVPTYWANSWKGFSLWNSSIKPFFFPLQWLGCLSKCVVWYFHCFPKHAFNSYFSISLSLEPPSAVILGHITITGEASCVDMSSVIAWVRPGRCFVLKRVPQRNGGLSHYIPEVKGWHPAKAEWWCLWHPGCSGCHPLFPGSASGGKK